jgi:P-type E1-E2 ATPase
VLVVSLLLFFAMLTEMLDRNIEKIMIFFKFLEIITYSLPAVLPIIFNLAYSFSLVRLRQNGIYGTESEKTIEGARIKTIYFDKTGTLTNNSNSLTSVFAAR